MASDPADASRIPGRRSSTTGFQWVTQSPSPAEVECLQASFPEVIKVPVEELAAEVADWQQRAVIVRSFHRWIPADAFLREFRRAGVSGSIVPISLAFRCHVFRFESKDECNLVLQRPWVINGQAVGTEAWRPDFIPAEDSVSTALLWVRLPHLPLEYWKEEFLRAILEPAGVFVCVDAATMAKSRGGYARVCLRVDLRRPLRPGTRIQGSSHPFWQNFVYESLEGVCLLCASLHLEGPCSRFGCDDGVAVGSNSVYGPWLVAIRKRKSDSIPQLVEKGKAPLMASSSTSGSGSASQAVKSGPKSGSGDVSEGWAAPAKVARRRSSSSSKPVFSLAAVAPSPVKEKPLCNSVDGPVPAQAERAGSKASVLILKPVEQQDSMIADFNLPIVINNPFSSLASDVNVEGQMVSTEASPGPLKRARPEVSLAPKTLSKPVKRKGKGKVSFSNMDEVSNSSSSQVVQVPCIQVGALEVVRAQSDGGAGLPLADPGGDPMGLDSCPLPQVQPSSSAATDLASDGMLVNPLLVSDEGSQLKGGLVDSAMIEDQGGVPSSSSL